MRDQIAQQLKDSGLGHYPLELPGYQNQMVRHYKLETPLVGKIEAVLVPNGGCEDKLRNSASNDDGETIERFRAVVCG